MTSAANAFAPLRAALEQSGIRYAIGGSWASIAFGEPRFTKDVDILADLSAENVGRFVAALPATSFYADREEASKALRLGRSFNVIHIPTAFKFDFFPAAAYPLGAQEIERATWVVATQLSDAPTPFVTPEDILLAKLHWYRLGAGVSEVQWRDIVGIVRAQRAKLDREYLNRGASTLGVTDLLEKALNES
jgi:hypothetical protein